MKNLSLTLVISGVLAALFGIAQEQWKVFIVGIVLMFGSAVFALLTVAARNRTE
jgi:hypothetical protein